MAYHINNFPDGSFLPTKNKAKALIDAKLAVRVDNISSIPTLNNIPADKALVCCVKNDNFDAAMYMYSEKEYLVWRNEKDRERTWLLIDSKILKEIIN
jgi:hypothetical protein